MRRIDMLIPFKDYSSQQPRIRTPIEQAHDMLACIREARRQDPNAQLFITYSANVTQAEKLVEVQRFKMNHNDQSPRGYAQCDNPLKGGSNQAAVLTALHGLLQRESDELKQAVFIWGSPTMYTKLRVKYPATKDHVDWAIRLLEELKVKARSPVLVCWRNDPDSLQPAAIGGGVMQNFDPAPYFDAISDIPKSDTLFDSSTTTAGAQASLDYDMPADVAAAEAARPIRDPNLFANSTPVPESLRTPSGSASSGAHGQAQSQASFGYDMPTGVAAAGGGSAIPDPNAFANSVRPPHSLPTPSGPASSDAYGQAAAQVQPYNFEDLTQGYVELLKKEIEETPWDVGRSVGLGGRSIQISQGVRKVLPANVALIYNTLTDEKMGAASKVLAVKELAKAALEPRQARTVSLFGSSRSAQTTEFYERMSNLGFQGTDVPATSHNA